MESREACETVDVIGEDGKTTLRINRADYDVDPSRWTLATGDGSKASSEPVEYDVRKDGKVFFVVNKANGERVTVNGNGVPVNNDGAGHKTDTDAWTAAYQAAT